MKTKLNEDVSSVSQKVDNYFNPTSNNGNNFWSSKPIQNYTGTNKAQIGRAHV